MRANWIKFVLLMMLRMQSSKDLAKRTISDKILQDRANEIALNVMDKI